MISFFKLWQNSPVKLPEHGAFLEYSIFITVIVSQICSLFLGSVLVIYMPIENHLLHLAFPLDLGLFPSLVCYFRYLYALPSFFLLQHMCAHTEKFGFSPELKNILCVFFWEPRMVLRLWRSGGNVLSLKRAAKSCFLSCDCPARMWLQGIQIFQSFLKSSWVCVRNLLTFQKLFRVIYIKTTTSEVKPGFFGFFFFD